MPSQFQKVASVSDLAEGEMIGAAVGEEKILVAKIGGEYFAINDICSHFYTLLSNGELYTDTCEVQCPLHDSRFCLRTGRPTDLPAEKPVEVYAVRIEGDDIVVGPRQDG